MRTQEQVELQYRNYVKWCAKSRDNYEAGYDPYFYGLYLGSAYALGFTLEKSMKEIQRDIERAEKKYK